ncbi:MULTISPECIES: outer membrane beta-barrel protein [Calothrix]|uniref:Outer membrane beta-barrel protein n=2 Tax=Calothrix TaxID=1186 RepID=A0ABR8AHK8_9CYAN|nr:MULTISPECIES: outer membrane beta-barrel protein [Calothrix]MBD2198446.1 outer membrane beta-barrel protein [Calothrix parietina FACHB-288]MBD2226848.1 outer membrane beta-barrel protein [Calothrix anomala FACHB-343]
MRTYKIALCSLATLLTWDIHSSIAADSPQPSPEDTIVVQLPVVPGDPNNPADFPVNDTNQTIDPEDVKDELGEIEIITPRQQQPPQRRQPDVQLLLRSSAFTSSNITGFEAFQPSDTVFINSATLLATPKLGEETRLVAAASGGLVRYADQGDFNYNYLNFNVGIQQRIARGMYGQLGWVQERLYRDGNGDRLLLDDSVRLSIGRQDQLSDRLRLDSFYELRASFATPSEQNRVANSLGARLRYDITPQLQGALDYRLSLRDFTQQERFDTQNQIGLEAIYSINPDLFISGSASYLFGASSDPNVDLDNFSVGISIGLNVPLF